MEIRDEKLRKCQSLTNGSGSRTTAARMKVFVMPPTARAMKAPLSQFRPSYENRDWPRFAFINFDTVRRGSCPQNHVSLASYFVTVSSEPFLIGTVQEDCNADGWMIVESRGIVGPKESVQINVKIRIVTPEFPAVQMGLPRHPFDNPRWRVASDMVQHPMPEVHHNSARESHLVTVLSSQSLYSLVHRRRPVCR